MNVTIHANLQVTLPTTSKKHRNFLAEKPAIDQTELLGKKLEKLVLSTPTTDTSSQKHRSFVAEPMGKKPVTDLAGIGPVLGKRLESKGFDKASVVLGQFLLLKKNKDRFVVWLKVEMRRELTKNSSV